MSATNAAPEAITAPRRVSLTNGILLATRGTVDSDAAVRVAHAFATRQHVPLEAIGVLPLVAPDTPRYEAFRDIDPQRQSWLVQTITDQLARASVNDARVVVEIGDAAELLVHEAAASGAAAVVLGLTPHDAFDRMVGAELVTRILRRGTVPVLAVAPNATGLMDTIVIGSDLSPMAMRLATLALAFASDGAAVHVVHVCSKVEFAPWSEDWRHVYETGAHTLLERFTEMLPLPPRAQVRRHVLFGDPAKVIHVLAAEQYADLIAVGTHRPGFAERMVLGSVAESVLRHADCSILIMPTTPH